MIGLWCIHIPGPDEYYAAPSEAAAHYMAERHNLAMAAYFERHTPGEFAPSIESVTATATNWPWSAEDHEEELQEFDAAAWGWTQGGAA